MKYSYLQFHITEEGLSSGGVSPVFMAGLRQGISRISKGNQNIVVHVRAANCL